MTKGSSTTLLKVQINVHDVCMYTDRSFLESTWLQLPGAAQRSTTRFTPETNCLIGKGLNIFYLCCSFI